MQLHLLIEHHGALGNLQQSEQCPLTVQDLVGQEEVERATRCKTAKKKRVIS